MVTASSVLLAIGLAAGLAWVGIRAPARLAVRTVDAGLLTLLVALVGARAGYVAINLDYFRAHPGEGWQVWTGGFSGVGAVLGFVLGVCLAALLSRERLVQLADRLFPLGMALGVSAWLAAWLEGSAYGATSVNWFGVPAIDERGMWARRFPTQNLGALVTLTLWVCLDWLQRQKASLTGRPAALGLLANGLLLLALSFTRADPMPLWNHWRVDTWGALGLTTLGLVAWIAVELSGLLHQPDNSTVSQ